MDFMKETQKKSLESPGNAEVPCSWYTRPYFEDKVVHVLDIEGWVGVDLW